MTNKFFIWMALCGLVVTIVTAFDPNINFSGYSWYLKRSGAKTVSPGPNWFGDSQNLGDGNNAGKNVWLAADGVHLTISKNNGKWWCSEIQNNELLGYGKYYSVVTGNFVKNDVNTVVGIFTYSIPEDYALNKGFEEIDIEFARWGDPDQPLLSMSVHPVADDPKSYKEFSVKPAAGNSSYTCITNWMPGKVIIQVYYGKVDISQTNGAVKPFAELIYTGINMPIFENGHYIYNYWLMNGLAPATNQEMVVNDFKFEPYGNPPTPPKSSTRVPNPPKPPKSSTGTSPPICPTCPVCEVVEPCETCEICEIAEPCEICDVCEVCEPVVETTCDDSVNLSDGSKYCCTFSDK